MRPFRFAVGIMKFRNLLAQIASVLVILDMRGGVDGKLLHINLIRMPPLYESLIARGATSEQVVQLAEHYVDLASPAEENINTRRESEETVLHDQPSTPGTPAPARENDVVRKSLVREQLLTIVKTSYFGAVEVGTPGQRVLVQFDSGSSNLWVVSSRVNCFKKATNLKTSNGLFQAGNATGCPQLRRYDHSKSSTYIANNQPFGIVYGSGSVRGLFSRDSVEIGGRTIKNVMFAEATILSLEFRQGNYDGIMGLGRGAIAVGQLPPIVQVMKQQGIIDHEIFSVFLRSGKTSPSHGMVHGGTLVFGGVDPSHYVGQIHYVPLVGEYYWGFRMKSLQVAVAGKGVSMASLDVCSGGCHAIADTGTSLIVGPEEPVDRLNTALGAPNAGVKLLGIFTELRCDGPHPVVTMALDGFAIELSKATYMRTLEIVGKDGVHRIVCVSTFLASTTNLWIMGDSFLQSFLTVFDYENQRLGFAEVKR